MRPLYLITPGVELRPRLRSMLSEVISACGRSIWGIQIREQIEPGFEASDADVLRVAQEILPQCVANGIRLIINSRPDLALATGAHGAHCGKRYYSLAKARTEIGDKKLVGYSAHSVAEAKSAAEEGASYLFLSPIYKSTSKFQLDRSLGIEPLAELCAQVKVPVFALGGINERNAAACKLAGAAGIAMIGSVFYADSPAQAALRLVDAWSYAKQECSVE